MKAPTSVKDSCRRRVDGKVATARWQQAKSHGYSPLIF